MNESRFIFVMLRLMELRNRHLTARCPLEQAPPTEARSSLEETLPSASEEAH